MSFVGAAYINASKEGEVKIQHQSTLFDGERLEPVKTNAPTTQSRESRSGPLEKALSSIDWVSFEAEVLALVEEAVARFNGLVGDGEQVSQFSIRTEPQSQTTFISVDTVNDNEAATGLTHSDNPAEFRYLDLCRRQHAVLSPLAQLNYGFSSHQKAADKRLSKSLRVVQRDVVAKQFLLPLPLAQGSGIGVSSAKAWYDYEILLNPTQKATR